MTTDLLDLDLTAPMPAPLIELDDVSVYPLATSEIATLTRCEAVISRGVQTFIEVGEALSEIRDGKLYRADFNTFEAYCRNKWGIGDSRARQLIGASAVAREIETVTNVTLSNEGQARAVAKAAPADRPAVIARADELAGDQPRTARHIAQAVEEIALPDLTSFGFMIRALPDGRFAIRSEGNLESQHSAAQMNDLIAFWRAYPPIDADLAAAGVVWRYRQDRMYQVLRGDRVGQTGYTAAECLSNQRASMERAGLLTAPAENDETNDDAQIADIRAQAEALDLKLIWEDDRVQLYWPEEADQLDRMYLLSYGAALEWLRDDAPAAAERRQAFLKAPAPADHRASDRVAYEDQEAIDLILLSKAEQAIARRDLDSAGDLLSQVQVATFRRDQMLATIAAPPQQTITLALSRDECAALLKEARTFESSGLTKRLPTIGQALVLLVQGIRGRP